MDLQFLLCSELSLLPATDFKSGGSGGGRCTTNVACGSNPPWFAGNLHRSASVSDHSRRIIHQDDRKKLVDNLEVKS
ncbi:hypothetical protein PIB30_045157 [Stylosanthes scabra]|uniref:Uncharacterized protein n=1 Tax=Stylosanthes scabra TaxID=79078 RepID=A0ABU6WH17_9FABA|nr:hypothetical protein [Stylosanthes scabra]